MKAELHLGYNRRGATTVLTHSRSTHPWHFLPPHYLDDTGCATTFLVNASGGLVGGDQLFLKTSLHDQTHVLLTTPSANKVYKSQTNISRQIVECVIGSEAILEYLPLVTIPFAKSRFEQVISIKLFPRATLFFWDALASGRIARGERWQFTHYANHITISMADGKKAIERYALYCDQENDTIGLVRNWDYVASLFLIGDGYSQKTWQTLQSTLNTILEKQSNKIWGSVSEPAIPGLIVKIVAQCAPDLEKLFQELWSTSRQHLLGILPHARRQY